MYSHYYSYIKPIGDKERLCANEVPYSHELISTLQCGFEPHLVI